MVHHMKLGRREGHFLYGIDYIRFVQSLQHSVPCVSVEIIVRIAWQLPRPVKDVWWLRSMTRSQTGQNLWGSFLTGDFYFSGGHNKENII